MGAIISSALQRIVGIRLLSEFERFRIFGSFFFDIFKTLFKDFEYNLIREEDDVPADFARHSPLE